MSFSTKPFQLLLLMLFCTIWTKKIERNYGIYHQFVLSLCNATEIECINDLIYSYIYSRFAKLNFYEVKVCCESGNEHCLFLRWVIPFSFWWVHHYVWFSIRKEKGQQRTIGKCREVANGPFTMCARLLSVLALMDPYDFMCKAHFYESWANR